MYLYKKVIRRFVQRFSSNTNLCLYVFILILFACIIPIGCKDKVKSGEVETKRERVRDIGITKISPSIVDDVYELTGSVKAGLSTVISSKVMGEIRDIYVKEGDVIRAGQVLIKIDDADIKERVKSAEKGFESAKHNRDLARKTYQRYKALSDEKAVSGQELDQVQTQMLVAEAEYERAKAMLNEALTYQSYTNITAPYNGIVTTKHIDKGSMAVQGFPLLSIESNEKYYIEVFVDESMLGLIKVGLPVKVYIDNLNNEFNAKVTEVIQSVDTKTRTFTAKIDLSLKNISSGMFVRVKFLTKKREALLISKDWIVKKGQLTGVYVVDEKGIIVYRLIKLGKVFGDKIEVLSGLTPKEDIVSSGIQKAFEGGIAEVSQR